MGATGPATGPEPLVWALPDTDRARVRSLLPRPERAERRARFRALLAALRNTPFDPEAVRDLLQEQRKLGADRARRAEEAIVARLTAMSDEARAAYADRLAQRVHRRGPR